MAETTKSKSKGKSAAEKRAEVDEQLAGDIPTGEPREQAVDESDDAVARQEERDAEGDAAADASEALDKERVARAKEAQEEAGGSTLGVRGLLINPDEDDEELQEALAEAENDPQKSSVREADKVRNHFDYLSQGGHLREGADGKIRQVAQFRTDS